jgi:Phosphoserine phosphatase RsbU, N-terminal domain
VTDLQGLTRDYRVALLRYLPKGDEAASTVGYEIGRGAVTGGVGLLELVRIHQEIVVEVLEDSRPEQRLDVAGSAGEFLLEVLGAFEMTQRSLLDE